MCVSLSGRLAHDTKHAILARLLFPEDIDSASMGIRGFKQCRPIPPGARGDGFRGSMPVRIPPLAINICGGEPRLAMRNDSVVGIQEAKARQTGCRIGLRRDVLLRPTLSPAGRQYLSRTLPRRRVSCGSRNYESDHFTRTGYVKSAAPARFY
jgi:hypothetical protein